MENGKTDISRRSFVKKSILAGTALGLTGPLGLSSGKSSPNNQVVVAVMGAQRRSAALARSFANVNETVVKSIFDVDRRPLSKQADAIAELQGRKPETGTDFRKALDDPDIDALVIGAPDHWHTAATIMALQAGKHVYVEKPASHNPAECELIVRAQKRYNKVVQMGNQNRSSRELQEAIKKIHDGAIGNAYYAKTFYANTRGSIGKGKIAPVPEWLDYELWQGPAPRTPYRDNILHYDWHWFWKWGTGELLNNGTHEYDIARWALGVDLPNKITSSGGRFHFDDDWEFYDTQNVMFEFPGNKAINWEGRSCNGFQIWNRNRGTVINGTEGTALLDRDGYILYNLDNEEIERHTREDRVVDMLDTIGAGRITDEHVHNFASSIQQGTKLHSPIESGQVSVLPLHLGNISQFIGRSLNVNPQNGRIIGDQEAMSMWSRQYEPGWEPRL